MFWWDHVTYRPYRLQKYNDIDLTWNFLWEPRVNKIQPCRLICVQRRQYFPTYFPYWHWVYGVVSKQTTLFCSILAPRVRRMRGSSDILTATCVGNWGPRRVCVACCAENGISVQPPRAGMRFYSDGTYGRWLTVSAGRMSVMNLQLSMIASDIFDVLLYTHLWSWTRNTFA